MGEVSAIGEIRLTICWGRWHRLKSTMAHKDRKINKGRGSRTCGYGSSKKHRGAGSRGGRGLAGGKKHKWSFFSKYRPGYFGKHGFKRPPAVVREPNVVNVGRVNEDLPRLIKEKKAESKGEKYYIDLKALGYEKLLGSGRVTNPLIIKVDDYSEKALKKIEEAGGGIESENEAGLH